MLERERMYRKTGFERLEQASIRIVGCGAVGSNLAVILARMGIRKMFLIDRDIIREENFGTQVWGPNDIGHNKATVLSSILTLAISPIIEAEASIKDIVKYRGKFKPDVTLTVDCLDNREARENTIKRWGGGGLLHCGMGEGFFEVTWDEHYIIPVPKGPDVCDYPMSVTLSTLTAATAAEIIAQYLCTGIRRNASGTMNDINVRSNILT